MSLKEARDRPGFWEAAPSGSEYAGFEDLWQRGAKRHGLSPAEAQALGWYGSADVTALKTKPELYIDNLERMIRRTAEQTGQNPRQVMEDVLRGKQYLKKKGGAVEKIKVDLEPLKFTVDPLESLFPAGPDARSNGNVANVRLKLQDRKSTRLNSSH